MSNRAHRNGRRRPLKPDADYGTTAGWCASEADLPVIRAQLHDNLIRLMGTNRVGPVQWKWWEGQAAVDALRTLGEDAVGEHSDYYRQIRGHLREYGGLLVVAMAEGKR